MDYLKIALRIQRRYKWFTLINMTGLALGILCSLTIFLYVYSHLSTDAHHPDADRIYRLVLDIKTPAGNTEYEEGTALPMARTLSAEYSEVESTAFCMKYYNSPTLTINHNGKVEKYKVDNIAAYADNNFISMFDYPFIAGDKSTALISPGSVVISTEQARKFFGKLDVVGQSININNLKDVVVTGVFETIGKNSALNFQVLVSLPTLKSINPNYQEENFSWIGSNNWTFVKLRQGSGPNAVDRQLPSFVAKHLGPDFKHWSLHLQPLKDMHFDTRYDGVINKTILWVLIAVAGALTLIVCINYINLSIAQSGYRAKEIGIRKYLGSSKTQLFFQFISETGVIIVISVVAALMTSYLTLPIVNTWLQTDLSLMQFASADKIVIIIFFTLALILLAGYYPGVVLSGFDPLKAIGGKITKSGRAAHLFRKSLICFQYSIALIFLISTFIILNQVDFLLTNDVGFSKESIVVLNVPKRNFLQHQSFRNEVEGLKGVTWASLHNQGPMSAGLDGGFIKYDNRTQFEDFIVRDRWADDRFLGTYSIQLVAGRNIVMRDSTTEVLVNESLVRKMQITNPEDVLGKSIAFDNSAISGVIVGVVRDFHHRSLQHGIEPLAIYPFPGVFNQVGIKLESADREQVLDDLARVWKMNFPDDVLKFSFLDQSLSELYNTEEVTGKMMRVFAVVSIIICSIGILGLSVFSALQRTKEIGVRKVLGASVLSIIVMLNKQYLALISLAFVITAPITYLLMQQWLDMFAYHVSPGWVVFVGPGTFMVITTLLIVAGQSLKAALTNPTQSLKYE